jgi:hypothetical protein
MPQGEPKKFNRSDRYSAMRALILRLDWENIHTHYGYTASCEDCALVALIREGVRVAPGAIVKCAYCLKPLSQCDCEDTPNFTP